MKAPDITFLPMPARLGASEKDERVAAAAKRLRYSMSFLDDQLRGIFPNDLVLLGAPSGMGKTDLALSIAAGNSSLKKRVSYLALEAEPRELERRIKFRALMQLAWKYKKDQEALGTPSLRLDNIDYAAWMANECGDVLDRFENRVDAIVFDELSRLSTFYRGIHFNADDLTESVLKQKDHADLIVVDHLHYVDAIDNKDEHAALADTTKALRDVALQVGKPVLAVAHLRKKDSRGKHIIAGIDDFHGSSNLTKIATQVITLDRAWNIKSPKYYFAPTFMTVLKDRRNGASGHVALTYFDRRNNNYHRFYTLGRVVDHEWQELQFHELPHWAHNHKPLESM